MNKKGGCMAYRTTNGTVHPPPSYPPPVQSLDIPELVLSNGDRFWVV